MHGVGSISVRPMRLSGGKSRVGSNYFLNDSFTRQRRVFHPRLSGYKREREREREHFEFSFFLHDGVKNS